MVGLRIGFLLSKIRTRLALNSITYYVEVKRLQWFGHAERMEKVICLVNSKLLKLVKIFPDEDLGKKQRK